MENETISYNLIHNETYHRFSFLSLYFDDITFEDLEYLSEDIILSSIDHKDKLSTLILLRKYFYNEIENERKEYDDIKISDIIANVKELSRFNKLVDVFGNITTDDLSYLDYDTVIKCIPKSYRMLMCVLLSRYATIIENTSVLTSSISDDNVRELENIEEKEDCLNLSKNDIGKKSDSDKYIITSLNGKWKYINICNTTLSSFERRDFFQKLSIPHFRKLIFIEKRNLNSYDWKRMIKEDYHELVRNTHKTYYENI